jgi:hypothetical protein
MLHKGGMEVYAENFYSYETGEIFQLPSQTGWLDKAEGKAIKILEPLDFYPPKDRQYRFIVMRRDYKEQARSQVKLLKATTPGFAANRESVFSLADSLKRDMPKLIKMLESYPHSSVTVLAFENLIRFPHLQAERIARFCGGLDVQAMADQVLKRDVKCLPYFLEMSQLELAMK